MVKLTDGETTLIFAIRNYLGFKNEPYSRDVSKNFLRKFPEVSYDRKNKVYTTGNTSVYTIVESADEQAIKMKNRVVFAKEINDDTRLDEIAEYIAKIEDDKPDVLQLENEIMIHEDRITDEINAEYCMYCWEVEILNKDEEWETVYSADNASWAEEWAIYQKKPPEKCRVVLKYYQNWLDDKVIYIEDPEYWYSED